MKTLKKIFHLHCLAFSSQQLLDHQLTWGEPNDYHRSQLTKGTTLKAPSVKSTAISEVQKKRVQCSLSLAAFSPPQNRQEGQQVGCFLPAIQIWGSLPLNAAGGERREAGPTYSEPTCTLGGRTGGKRVNKLNPNKRIPTLPACL